MIRPATIKDIPQLAVCWYNEKAKTCFSQLDVEWTVEGCSAFLAEALSSDSYYIAVDEVDGKVISACGVVLQKDLLPPHPLVVGEWMWWGTGKASIVSVLHDATAWGKQRGATLLRYVLNQRGTSPRKFIETHQWRVL